MVFGDLERRVFGSGDVLVERESALSQSQFVELGLGGCEGCRCSGFCALKFSLKGKDGKFACAVRKLLGDDVQRRLSLSDPVVGVAELAKLAWLEFEFEKFRRGGVVSGRGFSLLRLASENMGVLAKLLKEEGSGGQDLSWLYNRSSRVEKRRGVV